MREERREKKVGIFHRKEGFVTSFQERSEQFVSGMFLFVLIIISALNPFYWIAKYYMMQYLKYEGAACSRRRALKQAQVIGIVMSIFTYMVAIVAIIYYFITRST